MSKIYLHLIIFIFFHFFSSILLAQNNENENIYRAERPFALKFGFEGLGVDLSLGKHAALEASSWMIYNTVKVRLLLLSKNATPFIGTGTAYLVKMQGNGTQYYTINIGWEHSFSRVFLQFYIFIPYALETDRFTLITFPFFHIGYRL